MIIARTAIRFSGTGRRARLLETIIANVGNVKVGVVYAEDSLGEVRYDRGVEADVLVSFEDGNEADGLCQGGVIADEEHAF